jgi:hypothetical protein
MIRRKKWLKEKTIFLSVILLHIIRTKIKEVRNAL